MWRAWAQPTATVVLILALAVTGAFAARQLSELTDRVERLQQMADQGGRFTSEDGLIPLEEVRRNGARISDTQDRLAALEARLATR